MSCPKITSHYFITVFLILLSLKAASQQPYQNRLDSFCKGLITNIRGNETGKAHLVLDKSVYQPGERVWFKSFLTKHISYRAYHNLATLFIDVVNEKDSVVQRVLLNAANDQAGGQIILPAAISEGHYWVRAYTKEMLQEDVNNISVIPIYIQNPSSTSARFKKKTAPGSGGERELYVKFFPEGGSIMTGTTSRIGILLYDKEGNPIITQGYIKDNRDSVITSFATNTSGLAAIEIEPHRFRKYRAVIKWNGREFNDHFPAFDFFSGQLSIKRKDQTIRLRVLLEDSIYKKNALTYLVGLSKDSVCFASIGAGLYEVAIPDSTLPKGIVSFFLLDKNFKLLSERSIYIKENDWTLSKTKDSLVLQKEGFLKYIAGSKNDVKNVVRASLTIAVVDTSVVPAYDKDITAHILNDSSTHAIDNWFVAHLTNKSDEDVDVLMLCKHSVFANLIATNSQQRFDVTDSLFFIKGTVFNNKSETYPNRMVTLFAIDGKSDPVTATSDERGRFLFPLSGYSDSTQFGIQLINKNNKAENFKIIMDAMDYPTFTTPAYLKSKVDPPGDVRKGFVLSQSEAVDNQRPKLEEVTIEGKQKKNKQSSSIITSEELQKMGTGSLATKVLMMPGIQLVNGYVLIRGAGALSGPSSRSEPIVIIDGVQASIQTNAGGSAGISPVVQYLSTINTSDIESVQILKGSEATFYGVRGDNGVIAIKTATNTRSNPSQLSSNMYKFYGHGYAKQVDFNQATNAQQFPTTIYWNDNLMTDGLGKITFTINNPTSRKPYKIMMTGITAGGNIIYQVFNK